MIWTPWTRLDTHRVRLLPFSQRGLQGKRDIDTLTPSLSFIPTFLGVWAWGRWGACPGVHLRRIHCGDKWR